MIVTFLDLKDNSVVPGSKGSTGTTNKNRSPERLLLFLNNKQYLYKNISTHLNLLSILTVYYIIHQSLLPYAYKYIHHPLKKSTHMLHTRTLRSLLTVLSVIFFTSLSQQAAAQAGAVFTVAGGGTSTADGVPATSAYVANSTGIGMDAAGNFYYADRYSYVIRKVDGSTGLVYTVAGISGSSGHSGDGGPATAARLSTNIRSIHVTTIGDIYISDNNYIRKVQASTGIITTVAGGGTSYADGIPATSASINVNCVYVDNAGNVYFGTGNFIKKVEAATGYIYTIAGNGSSGDGGDGGPATNATVSGSAKSIAMDNAGNLYIISFSGNKIRKINNAGIITTVAGGGTSMAEGIPATNAQFSDFHNCAVDGAGNIFIADWSRSLVKRVDATTGIINTIAGVGSGGSLAEGSPALSASISPYMILVNPTTNNIYYSDFYSKVKKFSYIPLVPFTGGGSGPSTYSSDSFSVNIYKQCTGPQLTVRTNSFTYGNTVTTYFGDGTSHTDSIKCSWSGLGGYALFNHAYPTTDTYTVKHILFNSGVAVDSFSYNYDHVFCSDIAVRYYNDADLNCIKSSTEPLLIKPTTARIDSNGVPVDTITATSGFNYIAYGTPGDVYSFTILSTPALLYTYCPASGIIHDTLVAGITSGSTHFFALSCTGSSYIDLEAKAYVPVTGPNDQWGHLYISNNSCLHANASVTLNFSPKYRYTGGANPTPVSSTATSITWDLLGLSSINATPFDIYYVVWHNPAVPYPVDGDTVNEQVLVTPTTLPADINMSNNIVIRVDTVRTSCDPNAIEVSPVCFDNDTTLHFTVHFENIGSAPAINIYVMDTLSTLLDPSTFKVEMSTHPMFITKHVVNNKTIIKFDFPNINLADSSDHLNRDGMFMYTIKNKTSMATGNVALNRVGIYFDYNDVLMTNTATATKGCPEAPNSVTTATATSFSLYPNPAQQQLTIQSPADSYSQLTITSIVGQQLLQQPVTQPQFTINISTLPPGIYYATMQGTAGNAVKKFVKY